MSTHISENIKQIALPLVEAENCFMVDVSIRGERSSKVVEVFVDSDSGVTIDQCSRISRSLSAQLDAEDVIQGRYRLDVSSPGLDRPIKLVRQYKKNIGKNCKITTNENKMIVHYEGRISQVHDAGVVIDKNGKEIDVSFSDIIETYIIPKFK